MAMNRFSFYRLVQPMLSSFLDGPLTGKLKPYHSAAPAAFDGTSKHNPNINEHESDSEPFSIIDHALLPGAGYDYWMNKDASFQIIEPGMILLKNYISLTGQVDMVNICQSFCNHSGGFYMPTNQYGAKLRLRMKCFGRNWDPSTGYKNTCRSDGSEPPPIPLGFVHFAKSAVEAAQDHLDELPGMSPDMCVANFYESYGRLGLHQDRDESSDSLAQGLPVVSISIGDVAEFWYGYTRDEDKLSKVLLESGDVLIFGGKARLIYHGVKKIDVGNSPRIIKLATRMRPGRLNLTLRQVQV